MPNYWPRRYPRTFFCGRGRWRCTRGQRISSPVSRLQRPIWTAKSSTGVLSPRLDIDREPSGIRLRAFSRRGRERHGRCIDGPAPTRDVSDSIGRHTTGTSPTSPTHRSPSSTSPKRKPPVAAAPDNHAPPAATTLALRFVPRSSRRAAAIAPATAARSRRTTP